MEDEEFFKRFERETYKPLKMWPEFYSQDDDDEELDVNKLRLGTDSR